MRPPMPRSGLPRAKRLVVKVGTGTLTDGAGRFDRANCARLGAELVVEDGVTGGTLAASGAGTSVLLE